MNTTSANSSLLKHAEDNKKEIIKVTVILTILTIIELILGFVMMNLARESVMHIFLRGVIVILMVTKAFYIVAYFMHLKHELKATIMTIVVPLFVFIWFILTFLLDGNSFRNNRNKYDESFKQGIPFVAPANKAE